VSLDKTEIDWSSSGIEQSSELCQAWQSRRMNPPSTAGGIIKIDSEESQSPG
jgi:hypothetical protein